MIRRAWILRARTTTGGPKVSDAGGEGTPYLVENVDLGSLQATVEGIASSGDKLLEHLDTNRTDLEFILSEGVSRGLSEAQAAALALLRYRYPSPDGDRWTKAQIVWAFDEVGTREARELAKYWSTNPPAATAAPPSPN